MSSFKKVKVNQIVGSSRYPRNEECDCGSYKKYKKCCLPKEREEDRKRFLSKKNGGDEI